jgi:heat shock protein HtpX
MIPNQIKTILLLGTLTGILLVIGQLIGGTSGLTIAFIFAIVMNIGSYFYSHKLVLKIYKAKEIKKSDNPEIHEMIQEIANNANIPKPKIYLIPSENPNAFATGPNYKKSVVAVTSGILRLLSKEELKGVLAHEIAHIKNRDMLISTIAATIAAVISYVAFMARFAAIFGGMSRDDNSGGFIELLALAIIAPITAMIIQLAISRSREYIADETGARLLHNPIPLANALEKLEQGAKDHPMRMGGQHTAHMFITNPFRKMHFAKIFSTHPPMKERIKRLKNLQI